MTMMSELYKLIGQNISRIRKDKLKISQEQLARDLNLSRSFISHIESPNIDIGVSLDTLFTMALKYDIAY